MEQHRVTINRVINGGGIPAKNEVLNRVYANVLNKPVLVPGNGGRVWARLFSHSSRQAPSDNVEAAQEKLCPRHQSLEPIPRRRRRLLEGRALRNVQKTYFGFGHNTADKFPVGDVLPSLRKIAAASRGVQ